MNRSFAYSKNPLFHRRLFIEAVITWKFPGLEYFLSELPYLALHSITKELPLLVRFQRMILFLRVVMFKGLQTTTFTNDRIWYPTVNGVVSWTNSTDAHIGVVRWGYQACRCYSDGANGGQLSCNGWVGTVKNMERNEVHVRFRRARHGRIQHGASGTLKHEQTWTGLYFQIHFRENSKISKIMF